MLKYFTSTSLLLIWSVVLSVFWIVTSYAWHWRFRNKSHTGNSWQIDWPVIPSLVIAPLLVVGGFQLLQWNLIYPIAALATFDTLMIASLAPAFVLFVSSGMMLRIPRLIRLECDFWSSRTFITVAKAYGRSPANSLRKVVYIKTFLDSWSQCLPWLFGELLVVEAVFNAPGLGTDIWHQARMRRWPELVDGLLWLVTLYLICTILTHLGTRWLGKRLESYA